MSRSRASAFRPRFRPLATVLHVSLAALVLAAGSSCATSSPPNQDWLLLDAPHYRILSTLGVEPTRALAGQLESFRAGVAFLAGAPLAEAPRTRVFAFDDRSFSRPFDVRNESGYFLDAPDGGFLVLRQGGDFRRDATLELRHLHAHALLRGREGIAIPLWYDEGLAQVASTIVASTNGAQVGEARRDHVEHLLSWTWVPIPTVLGAFTPQELGSRGRNIYDSQTWAFHHFVRFGQLHPQRADEQLAALRERGASSEVLDEVFGLEPGALDRTLSEYASLGAWKQVELRVSFDSPALLRPAPLSGALAVEELARLAIALGRPSVAREYFERAVDLAPDASARARSGLATLAAAEGRFEDAGAELARALEVSPDDPIVRQDSGETALIRAQRETSREARAEILAKARLHFTQSAELEPARSSPLLRLAATHLLPGESAEHGLAYARRAAEIDRASLEGSLLTAQLLERAGRNDRARRLAVQLEARAHSGDIQRAASEMLDRLGRRTILE